MEYVSDCLAEGFANQMPHKQVEYEDKPRAIKANRIMNTAVANIMNHTPSSHKKRLMNRM